MAAAISGAVQRCEEQSRALLGALQQTACGLVVLRADAGAALDHVDEADAVRLAAERHAARERGAWEEVAGRFASLEATSLALEEALHVACGRCQEVHSPLSQLFSLPKSAHTRIGWFWWPVEDLPSERDCRCSRHGQSPRAALH